jgi:3-oxoacyl-[acyl-carrier protein] reductase
MDNVIVTGASRGLGLAIAERLAAADFNVITVARRESEPLVAAMRAAEAGKGAIRFRACDLSDMVAIPTLVREVKAEFGPIFGLVNNAGLGTEGLLATTPDPDIEALVRLNTLSPILMSKYVVRGMMAQRRGRVVNIASIVAATGFNALSVYAATKASLVGFTRSLAREVGKLGVTVNAVAPGFIDTARNREAVGAARNVNVGGTPAGRLGTPEEIAATVAFLASDDAGFFVGATISPNGGLVTAV